MKSLPTRRTAAAVATLLATLAPAAVAGADEANAAPLPPTLEDRAFRVYLDDREVGAHSFRFEGAPADFRLVSKADFAVKIAFVTVFSYDHEAREHWVDGCMVALDSRTDSKEDFRVQGERSAGGFAVDAGAGGQTYDLACPWGFAYWNPALRTHDRLINPQDGRLLEVTFDAREPRPLSIDERSVRASVWSLSAEDMDITLYYDEQDRWIGLDSEVGGGRTLRYRPAPEDPFYPG